MCNMLLDNTTTVKKAIPRWKIEQKGLTASVVRMDGWRLGRGCLWVTTHTPAHRMLQGYAARTHPRKPSLKIFIASTKVKILVEPGPPRSRVCALLNRGRDISWQKFIGKTCFDFSKGWSITFFPNESRLIDRKLNGLSLFKLLSKN